jgi:hypothetical protein
MELESSGFEFSRRRTTLNRTIRNQGVVLIVEIQKKKTVWGRKTLKTQVPYQCVRVSPYPPLQPLKKPQHTHPEAAPAGVPSYAAMD